MKHKTLDQRVADQRAKDTKAWKKRANQFVRELNEIVVKQSP